MRLSRYLLCLALLLAWASAASAQGNNPRQAIPVRCVNTAGTAFEACGGAGGGGGGGAVTTDPDDGSIAAGQTNDNSNSLNMVYSGAAWVRQTYGAAGTAGSQVWTIQGITNMTPILATVTGNLTNISGTISLPTGAATAAAQTTSQTSFTNLEAYAGPTTDAAATAGSVGSINAKLRLLTTQLDAVKTSVELIDNAISGVGFNISQIGGATPTADMTADFDSGAGTQTGSMVGLAVAASGGGVPIQGTAAEGLEMQGSVAHDAVDAGNPLLMGYRAIAYGTNPTAVAAADRTVGFANRAGVPFVLGGHPNIITKTALVVAADGAQTGTALATVSSGAKVVVTRASVKCSADNSVKPDFRLVFDTDSTLAAASTTGVAGEIVAFNDIPAGGGFVEGDGAGMLGVGADDEDLRYSLGAPTSGSCNISVSYYTIES